MIMRRGPYLGGLFCIHLLYIWVVVADPWLSVELYGEVRQQGTITSGKLGRLLSKCYAGFGLTGCKDMNTSLKWENAPANFQYTAGVPPPKHYCVECCSIRARTPSVDETWDIHCPFKTLNALMVQPKLEFVFPRRLDRTDVEITRCDLPRSGKNLFLAGYRLEVEIGRQNSWLAVLNCKATVTETVARPTTFVEVIHIYSRPQPYQFGVAWTIGPLTFAGVLLLLTIPLYKGIYKGDRCSNCGSWFIVYNTLCLMCIVCGCRVTPPKAKVFCPEDLKDSSSSSSSSDDTSEEEDDK